MPARPLAAALFAASLSAVALAADPINPVGFPKAGDPGGGVGCFRIWYEGDTWHLRTSTENSVGKKDKIMVFTGTVRSDGKMAVEGSRLEKGNGKTSDGFTPHADGKGFDFTFKTYGAIDQADFKITGGKAVNFKLLIDGEKAPALRVIVGEKGEHPPKNEFALPAAPKKPEK
jgi:hypothetical protein